MRFLVALVLSLCGTTACTARPSDQKQAPIANSLLWKVSGKGLSKPSYVFGTIHAICQSDYLWTSVMQRSFAATDVLCLEMDLDDPSLMMQAAMGMMSTDGKMLRDYFTKEQYARLEAYAEDSLGTSLDMLQMMKPVVLVSLFATKGGTCDSSVSYEMNLMKLAKGSEKEVEGLEAAQEQLEVLNSLPADSIVHEVMNMIDGKQEKSGDFDQLVAAYKKQDLNLLNKLIESSGGFGEQKGPFLDDRNKRWISRMEKKMKSESVFFAVGAGHLPGSNGVLALLRKAGYTVEPVL